MSAAKKPSKILNLIPKIMGEIGAIAKLGRNDSEKGYSFRRIDDVYNALQPLLVKHGVFFTPTVIESKEERLENGIRVKQLVRYRFYASDGSIFDSTVEGEAFDESDKATNKAMQAALKFMLTQVFCIAVAEVPDADSTSPKLNFSKGEAKSDSKDPKIPNGIYRGKRLSEVPRDELLTYIKNLDDATKVSGRKHPKWFMDLKTAVGA